MERLATPIPFSTLSGSQSRLIAFEGSAAHCDIVSSYLLAMYWNTWVPELVISLSCQGPLALALVVKTEDVSVLVSTAQFADPMKFVSM